MLEEKYISIGLELPQIQSTYIILNQANDNIIQNNITYHNNILIDDEKNIEKILLSDTDNIIKIVKGRKFKINEKILMIQRYLHNDLDISYKDVLNVEILYSEKGNSILPDNGQIESINNTINSRIIHRYPNEGRFAIDFQATILDTFIDCELKRENITDNDKQMYIIVIVSNNTAERKVIGELVNRYLFIENKESHEDEEEEEEYKYISPSIHNHRVLPRNNISNYIRNTLFYPYTNNYINSQVTSNEHQYRCNEQKLNNGNRIHEIQQQRERELKYSNRIHKLEQQRERELNDIRQTFNRQNRRTGIFVGEINMDDIDDINPLDLLLEQNQTSLIGNLINLLMYVNDESMNNSDIVNLMEPVRVTVSENDMKIFLTSFEYSEFLEEYKQIKIKEQTTCPICLSNYENDEMVSYLNTCNHLFHTTCISKWLTDFNHKCPVCRLSANPSKNNIISPNEQNNVISPNEQNNIISPNEQNNVISPNEQNNIISPNEQNNVNSTQSENLIDDETDVIII